MKIVVTGGAGFIGSNIIRGLNERGIADVIVVDDLKDGQKFLNLRDLQISDYFDAGDFYNRFARGDFGQIEAVFHEGACSDTMEHDGEYMMRVNYRCSRDLADACAHLGTRLLYASSAATYGDTTVFREEPRFEGPLNVYGYSKLLFDNVIRSRLAGSPVQLAGFRYFNVYGPRENHKGRMASVAFHHFNQLEQAGKVKLFGGYDGYEAGQQSRDFVFIDDVVATNLWFFDNPSKRGIFNLGTGRAQPFNDVAHAAINAWRADKGEATLSLDEQIAAGLIEYVEFPEALKGKYQSFTQGDISALRAVGYSNEFATVAQGVSRYYDWFSAGR